MSTLRVMKSSVVAAAALSMMIAGAPVTETSARTMVRVAYSSISGAGVVTWLAVDKGLFAKNDLDVELIYVAGSQAMQSLLSGTTPIGIQGIEPVFRVNAHGSDTVMLLSIVTKPPFSIMVRPEIKDYRELKGKAMGITRYGSSTDMLLRLSLEKWGFKPETDVSILQMGGVPPILAGMESRKIVGGPLSLPTLARARKEGYRELADVADLVPEYQVAGVVTRRAFIKQNPDVVRGFVKAIAEAMAVFSRDPEAVRQVMKSRFKIDDQLLIDETQKDYQRYMPKVPYPSRAGIAVIKSFLDKNEPGVRPLSIDDQIDNQFVRELEQSGFINNLYRSK
ncbi:MAG TPA: ABC transporter substrate-binding protein [Candidatus Eisenbacteria bacterium]|jgi:NitT/TauT family transport system substrate-binding protein|nr:ABC transporter substrate-binding protein [Candidatus Eisenbacteria bacterium]